MLVSSSTTASELLEQWLKGLGSNNALSRKSAAESLRNYGPKDEAERARIRIALINATLPSKGMDHYPDRLQSNMAIVRALERHGQQDGRYVRWLLKIAVNFEYDDEVNDHAVSQLKKISRENPTAIEYWVKEDPALSVEAASILIGEGKGTPQILEELSGNYQGFETATPWVMAGLASALKAAKTRGIRLTDKATDNLLSMVEAIASHLEKWAKGGTHYFFRPDEMDLLETTGLVAKELLESGKPSKRLADVARRLSVVANKFPGDKKASREMAQTLQDLAATCTAAFQKLKY
ncbi:MAG: hypothetical protein HY537_06385 [Deltaproteobacteria bacterium]|nr:hypothetical protein [Deltaproteobacteria bacterium]